MRQCAHIRSPCEIRCVGLRAGPQCVSDGARSFGEDSMLLLRTDTEDVIRYAAPPPSRPTCTTTQGAQTHPFGIVMASCSFSLQTWQPVLPRTTGGPNPGAGSNKPLAFNFLFSTKSIDLIASKKAWPRGRRSRCRPVFRAAKVPVWIAHPGGARVQGHLGPYRYRQKKTHEEAKSYFSSWLRGLPGPFLADPGLERRCGSLAGPGMSDPGNSPVMLALDSADTLRGVSLRAPLGVRFGNIDSNASGEIQFACGRLGRVSDGSSLRFDGWGYAIAELGSTAWRHGGPIVKADGSQAQVE